MCARLYFVWVGSVFGVMRTSLGNPRAGAPLFWLRTEAESKADCRYDWSVMQAPSAARGEGDVEDC